MIQSGEASFALNGTYRMNDMVWTDRILHPDKFDLDKQFRTMMPSEAEMILERLRDKASGGDFLAVFDDDDDDEDLV